MRTLTRPPQIGQKIHGEALPEEVFGGVLTIGNYDGLHLGHQSLLKTMQALPGPRTVITFEPHPLQVLQPQRHLKRVFPREDLSEHLPDFDVDWLIVLPFDRAFAAVPAREFLERYVGEPFRPRHIVAGYDFAFGNGREGTLDMLKSWAAARAVEVHVVPPLRIGGEIVSSRRIRDLVMKGDVHGAALLLGRPYYVRGEVIAGAGRGAQIGVPTLNQKPINETLPAIGVYVSRTHADGRIYGSVTNVGTNPTFENGHDVKIETHVLDITADWRGKVIDVELIERLRDEKKFAGVEELKKQIGSDITKARAILGSGT
jgi:riboflavin kinase/FMN adenylyltransferase